MYFDLDLLPTTRIQVRNWIDDIITFSFHISWYVEVVMYFVVVSKPDEVG